MKKIIIGADGGGTATKLAASDENGNILGYHVCGGINYNIQSFDISRKNLADGISNLLKKIGEPHYDYLSVGHSALSDKATAEEKIKFCGDIFPVSNTDINSDVYMALVGTLVDSPGIMVVSGTGSMCVGRNEAGDIMSAGGWGYLLGDEGSSFYIAREGIVAAIHDHENNGEKTLIKESLLNYFNTTDIRDIINIIYDKNYEIYNLAKFARNVIECYRANDNAAKKIVKKNLEILAGTAFDLLQKLLIKSGVIGIYGGLFEHNPDIVSLFEKIVFKRTNCFKIKFPEFEPEIGAVISYFQEKNLMNEKILSNIKKTKK